MRCYINADGVLHVEPDSPMEQYAVRKWCEEAFIRVSDPCRNEHVWCKGSKIIVHAATIPASELHE